MANKQKLSQLVVNNVLAFINPFASKTLKKAISILLHPCCIPNVELSNPRCGWDNIDLYGTSFDISIVDPILANETLQLVVLTTANEITGEAGVVVNIVLDAEGKWSGRIKTPLEGCPHQGDYDAIFTIYLISNTMHIVHISNPITIFLPNCC